MPTPVKPSSAIKPTDLEELMRWVEWQYDVRLTVSIYTEGTGKAARLGVLCEARKPGAERYSAPLCNWATMWPSSDHQTLLGAYYHSVWKTEMLLAAAKALREALAEKPA